MNLPERGFSETEFEARTALTQRWMHAEKLDALLLTTEPMVRYFSGFLSQFWASPTRPWFLIVPSQGKPIAVIPSIGVAGMRSSWIDDIHCWSSPHPDDDGVSLLASTLNQLTHRHQRIGVPLGVESHLRMPAQDFQRLRDKLDGIEFTDCALSLLQQCSLKSAAEVEKISAICELASDSFEALPSFAVCGDNEREIVRAMRIDLLKRGVDHTPFIVSASGPDGYGDIIMGPSDRSVVGGDILIIDTGSVFDGYFCDFDRNFAFGQASDQAKSVYQTLFRSTEAGFAVAHPGAKTADVWQAMWSVLEDGGAKGNSIGRMGHGLGAQLTEWPSFSKQDRNQLEAGMVMTLEPGMIYGDGKLMVHEENILITEDGAQMLSRRASEELPVITP